MTDEKLERANELKVCLETLEELRDTFENKEQLSVCQVGTTGLTEAILSSWKEMNIDFINAFILDVEKEFKKL